MLSLLFFCSLEVRSPSCASESRQNSQHSTLRVRADVRRRAGHSVRRLLRQRAQTRALFRARLHVVARLEHANRPARRHRLSDRRPSRLFPHGSRDSHRRHVITRWCRFESWVNNNNYNHDKPWSTSWIRRSCDVTFAHDKRKRTIARARSRRAHARTRVGAHRHLDSSRCRTISSRLVLFQ